MNLRKKVSNIIKNKERSAELSLVLITLIWGSGFVATEYVIQANWSTSLIMVSRFTIASIILAIVLNKSLLKLTKDEITHGIIAGIFLFLGFYTQTLGQTATNVSNVAFLTSTNVVMIPFIAWAFSRKRPSLQTLLLTFLALFGVGVLTFNGEGFVLGKGDLLILLCAFFFASQIAYLEKATEETDPTRINFVQILVATILSLGGFLFEGQGIGGADISEGILPIIFLGLFSTCICFFFQTNAQKHVTSSKVGIILSLEGVFGGLFSVALGLEPMTKNLLLGGTIIIAASILSNIDFTGNFEGASENLM